MENHSELTLEGLAAKIGECTKEVVAHLKSHDLPQPSFSADGPASYPAELRAPRMALVDAARDLLRLAMGPKDHLFFENIFLHHDSGVLDVLNQFDFWNAVPVDGSATYAEIAAHVGLPEELVRRILRYAMTNRLFSEAQSSVLGGERVVVHSATTAFVARNPTQRSWIGHNREEVGTAATKLPEALRRFSAGRPGPSQELEETSFAIEFADKLGGDPSYWSFVENDDGEGAHRQKGFRTKQFSEAMQVAHSSSPLNAAKLISEGFDWAGLGKGTVVDVGGSTGHECISLAKAYPDLQFIVQDRPAVEPAFDAKVPAELAGSRITFQPHDFFEPQPVAGADVYFLKLILHDWPDKHSVRILRALLPALRPGNRVVLCEGVAPPIGGGPEWERLPSLARRMLAAADLQMLVLFNAKQRSMHDWKALLAEADERLELVRSFFLPGSATGMLEVVFKGSEECTDGPVSG